MQGGIWPHIPPLCVSTQHANIIGRQATNVQIGCTLPADQKYNKWDDVTTLESQSYPPLPALKQVHHNCVHCILWWEGELRQHVGGKQNYVYSSLDRLGEQQWVS